MARFAITSGSTADCGYQPPSRFGKGCHVYDASEDVENFREYLGELCREQYIKNGSVNNKITAEAMEFDYLPSSVDFEFCVNDSVVSIKATFVSANCKETEWKIETLKVEVLG